MEGNESVTLCYSLFFEGLWQVTVTSYQNTLKNIKAERKIISGGFLSSYDSCSRPNQCSCSKTQSICHSFGPLWSRRSCQTQTFPHVSVRQCENAREGFRKPQLNRFQHSLVLPRDGHVNILQLCQLMRCLCWNEVSATPSSTALICQYWLIAMNKATYFT